jgi:hypothetical protein
MIVVDVTRCIGQYFRSAPQTGRALQLIGALAIVGGLFATPAVAVTICDNSVSPGFSAFVEQRNPGHWTSLTGAGIEPATHVCTANNRVGRLRNTPGQFNGGAILYKSSAAPGSARRNADVTFKVPTAADFLNWSHVAAFPAYYPDLGTGDPNAFGRIGAAVFKDELYVVQQVRRGGLWRRQSQSLSGQWCDDPRGAAGESVVPPCQWTASLAH